MDNEQVRSDRERSSSASESTGRIGFDGFGEPSESSEPNRTARDADSGRANASAAPGTGKRRGPKPGKRRAKRKEPVYTRPPLLNDAGETVEPARRVKPDKTTVTRKACAAVVGVGFLIASAALTGTAQLRATDSERREIGGALADALAYFEETSPFVRLLNVLGPWAGVIDGLANAILERVLYVSEHRAGKYNAPSPSGPAPIDIPFPANGRARIEDEEIVAPNPGAFT
jgi:hypothetical protein